jgi:hypothetical protein
VSSLPLNKMKSLPLKPHLISFLAGILFCFLIQIACLKPPTRGTRVVYVDRPATQEEVEAGDAAVPTETVVYKPVPADRRKEVCVEAPDYLAPRPKDPGALDPGNPHVLPHDTSDVARDSSGRALYTPFDLLPHEGGVTEQGPDIQIRRYNPDTYRWYFDTYEREYKQAWFAVAGTGVFRREAVIFGGLGRRNGRLEYWIAPAYGVKNGPGIMFGGEFRL